MINETVNLNSMVKVKKIIEGTDIEQDIAIVNMYANINPSNGQRTSVISYAFEVIDKELCALNIDKVNEEIADFKNIISERAIALNFPISI